MAETPDQADRPEEANGTGGNSTPDLLRSIAADSAGLVRKELELARHELVEAVVARVKAGAAALAGGVLALLALVFAGLTVATGLDAVLEPWASRLAVTVGFGVLAGVALAFGAWRARQPPLVPEETRRTVKEDVEWARTQLRR